MKLIINYIFLLIISLLTVNSDPLSLNEIKIPEGVYNIILKKKYSSISYNKKIYLTKDKLGSESINFRIKISKSEQESKKNSNSTYYTIEHMKTNLFLGIKTNNTMIDSLILNPNTIENETISFLFKFSKIEDSVYIIQSKNGCFLGENNQKIICSYEKPNELYHFHLLKLFSEVEKNKKDEEIILEKEPIDVLIKYIDLSDPNLVREGIHQIKKDNENEELKYSIRSILKNIPWVRKIFILMPNEKVRYFKEYDLIKEKIVYVKDKDFLGHDSSNSHAFQYRFWKMKEYGISDNFIIMDDDYFIGKPLKKSDFFYVENNTVVPAIISMNYQVHTQRTFLKEYNNIKKKLKDSREQSSNTFMYSMYNTYYFFIDYFNGPIIVPYFTHNAIPSCVKDLKEIFDIVENSKYKNATLESIVRHIDSLQFQTSVNIYTFNKYSRKVNIVKYNYIDTENALQGNFDYPLFCINTGNNKEYQKISFPIARLVMDKLFPEPSPYEIIDYNIIPKLGFELVKRMEDDINKLKNNEDKATIIKLKAENVRKKRYVEKCDTIIEKFNINNKVAFNQTINLKKELDNCLIKLNKNGDEAKNIEKETKNYIINEKYQDVKNELEKNIEEEKNNRINLNMYESGINENKKEIEKIQKKQSKLFFIAYLEFGIIFIFVILIFVYYFLNKNSNRFENIENKMDFSV